jgi:hypothetical protein
MMVNKSIAGTATLASCLLLIPSGPALADAYFSANFTFGIFGGNANQMAPFQGVVAPYPSGGTFTGSLVFDQSLVPAAGSGYVNVPFSSFPDIAQIPSATALSLPLGSLPAFTLDDAVTPPYGTQEAAIQYYNGAFVGLFYISDFMYQGSPYELQIQGGSLDIVAIVGGYPTFSNLASGYVDRGLSNVQPYTPTSVPEPGTLALLGLGLAGIGFARRRRKS